MCCCYLEFLESSGIVGVLVIYGLGRTKGDKLLGELSKEKTHERLVGIYEMMDGWIGGRGYLSSPGSCCSDDPDGIEEKLEGGGIAGMDEGRAGEKGRGHYQKSCVNDTGGASTAPSAVLGGESAMGGMS